MKKYKIKRTDVKNGVLVCSDKYLLNIKNRHVKSVQGKFEGF